MTANIYKSAAGRAAVLAHYDTVLESWPVPCSKRRIPTHFGDTFVIDSGSADAPPLVLLHGSVSNSFAWMGDIEALSQHYRVLAVDLIGEAGYSAPTRPTCESGAYPQWLDEVMTGLAIDQAAFAGLSLGGWMALAFATSRPERVASLCLLCPGGLAPINRTFLPKALGYALLGAWGHRKTMELVNGGPLPASEPGLDDAMAFTGLIGRHFKPRTAPLPVFDAASLARLTMPVQLVFGENDYLLQPHASCKHLAGVLPHAQIDLLPDTGHLLVAQADRMLAFLNDAQPERV